MFTDHRGYFTEDERPQRGSDGWYIVWRLEDPETGDETSYAEHFDTEADAQAAITPSKP